MEFAELLTPQNGLALLTLTALEIVLGIDNIVFIAILTSKLPEEQQARARNIGLGLAMFMRIALLLAISWVMGLTAVIAEFTIFGNHIAITGRDLILLIGGGFLIGKATYEIHEKIEEHPEETLENRATASFASIIIQILVLDIVFSLDSVITAVGMADEVAVMIAAVVIAVGVMLVFAGRVSAFIEKHPTLKMLALSFLLLIGVMLVVESLHGHIPKGYIYFAMAFSIFVEMLNIRVRSVGKRAKH